MPRQNAIDSKNRFAAGEFEEDPAEYIRLQQEIFPNNIIGRKMNVDE